VGSRPVPQKLYYRIGEVAEIAAVRPHVLRYWETEFGFLSPRKNEGNHRLYTQKDLQKVLTIKKLLYEDRYTIAGAKRRFREEWRKAQDPGVEESRRQILKKLRHAVEELMELLGNA
jgi:DNA-binding transcriptional MerR regulator